jgi:hypothetical protein
MHTLKSLVPWKQLYSPSCLFVSQKRIPLVSILSESHPVTNATMPNAEIFFLLLAYLTQPVTRHMTDRHKIHALLHGLFYPSFL